MSPTAALRVRPASMGDYDALCALFDELDAFHRDARPEMFQPFPKPVRAREQVARCSASVEWARQRGASHVEVAVHDFNQEAERFYKSFGFARSVNRLMLAA
jgi:hypothetical protein